MPKHSFRDEEKKTRTFDLVLYEEPTNVLPHLHNVRHYAYILHNHDVDEKTGELKKEHYHLILVFNNPRSVSGLNRELLRYLDQNVFIEPVKNSIGCSFLYLIHESKKAQQEGKIPYKIEEVTCDDIAFWNDKARECCEETENTYSNERFIYDLYTKTPIELAVFYGRDYIKNMRAYNDFAGYMKGLSTNILDLINTTIENLL